MVDQPQKSKSDVVVSVDLGQTKSSRFGLGRLLSYKRSKGILALLIVLLAVMTGLTIWNQHKADEKKKAALANAQILTNVDKYIHNHNYKAAINALDKVPRNKQNDLLRVSIYQNEGDYKTALDGYQKVIKQYGSNFGLIEAAANTAEAAHDYKQAIAYYKQARQFVAQEKPYATQQADEAHYDEKIKSLEALAQ